MIYAIPNGVNFQDTDEGDTFSEPGASFVGSDAEVRLGLDERSDIGVRAPGGVGVVLNYKRRVAGGAAGPALALMGGGGFINLANHAHLELTAIVSGVEASPVTPYGGLRAMQAIALSAAVPGDDPTLGGFAGVRIGDGPLGLSVEVGLFYDPSATGIRKNDWIVVPSLTLHGRGFGRLFPF
jgi:hypothetical protein